MVVLDADTTGAVAGLLGFVAALAGFIRLLTAAGTYMLNRQRRKDGYDPKRGMTDPALPDDTRTVPAPADVGTAALVAELDITRAMLERKDAALKTALYQRDEAEARAARKALEDAQELLELQAALRRERDARDAAEARATAAAAEAAELRRSIAAGEHDGPVAVLVIEEDARRTDPRGLRR